jgi:hypothetical protein
MTSYHGTEAMDMCYECDCPLDDHREVEEAIWVAYQAGDATPMLHSRVPVPTCIHCACSLDDINTARYTARQERGEVN